MNNHLQVDISILERKLHRLPSDSNEIALLGMALPAECIRTLKDHQIPVRWAPQGCVYTLQEFAQQAQELLKLH